MSNEIRSRVSFGDLEIDPDLNGRVDSLKVDVMVDSLLANGQDSPLFVREGGPDKSGKRKLVIVSGHRRYAAMQKIRAEDPTKFTQVLVSLKKVNEEGKYLLNFRENADREDLSPLEEANQLQKMMAKFGWSQAEMAAKLPKPKSFISQRLALLKEEAAPVREALEKKSITSSAAREVLSLPAEAQKDVLEKIEEREKKTGKKMTSTEIKEEADKKKEKLGIKRDRKPNNAPEVDKEKLKLFREHYEDREGTPLKTIQIRELLATEIQALDRAKSDESKSKIKTVIATLEKVLGYRG